MSIFGWVVFAIIVVIFILIFTLVVTKKGYEYKHTVDPLPQDDDRNKEKDETK
ncbi:YtzI protein [Oceanobacillus halophilus]|uniref:YtzI protein n=1 Tax=Oceanobacillus halophilus TaxID=930130 RepID=UPI001F4E800B|nr:YtzI protein [Oceanobacillus halophilus]